MQNPQAMLEAWPAGSVLLSWIFVQTRSSVLVAALFHSAMNVARAT
jgi:membrane protease YdiL (CAAX protease family)